MIMRIVTAAALFAGGASTSALGHSGATPECSTAAVKGVYGITGAGAVAAQPSAFLGTISLDGLGHLTGSMTVSMQAPALSFVADLSGATYSVERTCTGRLSMPFRLKQPVDTAGVGDHAHDMAIVVTDGGARIAGLNDATETEQHVPLPGVASMTLEARRL